MLLGLNRLIPFDLQRWAALGGSSGPNLPLCVDGITVAWHQDLNETTNDEVQESIGTQTRDIFYGQGLTAGVLNFYRSSGTFDYTNPTTGVEVLGVTIPANGEVPMPAGGVCDIHVSDGSYYPVCERDGIVLHDVSINSHHITILSPTWSESLYGTDYLNQYGFVTKAQSDAKGYLWETDVIGFQLALSNNTLVPFGQWEYTNLQDVNGEDLLDSNDEQLLIKVGI